MVYIALVEIGDYKKGDIVPDAKAKEWLGMYLLPPVEKRNDNPASPKKEDSLDINRDGKFDKDDKKLAGKVLASKNKKR